MQFTGVLAYTRALELGETIRRVRSKAREVLLGGDGMLERIGKRELARMRHATVVGIADGNVNMLIDNANRQRGVMLKSKGADLRIYTFSSAENKPKLGFVSMGNRRSFEKDFTLAVILKNKKIDYDRLAWLAEKTPNENVFRVMAVPMKNEKAAGNSFALEIYVDMRTCSMSERIMLIA